ncbi:MAG: helix-hairpin-helix domain-containing protein [Proteobacteria bacterium]|nr:helix-hairpin-helix domain-containing protein [Pseudomonadota bacterium]
MTACFFSLVKTGVFALSRGGINETPLDILVWLQGDIDITAEGLYAIPEKISMQSLNTYQKLAVPVEVASDIHFKSGVSLTLRNGHLPHIENLVPLATPFFFLPVPINTADESTLLMIPGIGPHLAAKIVSHRNNKGKFSSIDELAEVKGIGSKKLEKMRKLIRI